MPTWDIQRLDRRHDRSAFDCGVPELNEWIKTLASQYDRRDLARAYVAVMPAHVQVLGYYAISNHRVSYESLPQDQARGLPRIDVPVVLLGRLAIDLSTRGQRLGEHLLLDALRRTQHISEQIGVRAVEVDAMGDAARGFYLRYGFTSLLDDPNHLFLPMQVIRKMKLPPLV